MTSPLSSLSSHRLEAVRNHYDHADLGPRRAATGYRRWVAHYLNLLIPPSASVLEIGCGDGELLSLLHARNVTGVDLSSRQVEAARRRIPHGRFHVQAGETLALAGPFDFIVVSDTLNEAADVQYLLERAAVAASGSTRLIVNFHSALWRPILSLAGGLGWQRPHTTSNWLGVDDVVNLLRLSGWDVIKKEARLLCPVGLAGLDTILNRWVAPLLPWFCLGVFCVARRAPAPRSAAPTVSVIIPARNEMGNIEAAVLRTPALGSHTEIIFIEGHSKDATWQAIVDVQQKFPERDIKIMRQTGRGKGNAVREAFDAASGEMLMILDADLTMPPEELPKYYEALLSGTAEFANGVRLVYPMEERAMRFLNMCANKFFSIAFTWLLGQSLKDTLCGTKVLWKDDYRKIAENRAYFGEFDPFGDFDLLFGADKLNLKIVDIPIRYQERTYGETNIQRWKHGALLLRMVCVAAWKLKFV